MTRTRSALFRLCRAMPAVLVLSAMALVVAAQQPVPSPPDPAEPPAEASADTPSWLERLLFNPRERTARGIQVRSQQASAVGPTESAMRLRPDDAVSTFNAGTARLDDARADAAPLLESATATAPPALAARAAYNLGNARRDQSDLPGAIDAYRQALRQDPTFADAKFNLELARKLLEQQQQEQQDQENQDGDEQQEQDQENQDQQNQDGEQNQEQQDQENQDQQDQEQEPQDQQNQDQQDQQNQDGEPNQDQQDQQPDPRQQGAEEQPLPQFENLEDMTAEEAAAILEAVENLEREARRQEALAATQANARGKKDW